MYFMSDQQSHVLQRYKVPQEVTWFHKMFLFLVDDHQMHVFQRLNATILHKSPWWTKYSSSGIVGRI